MYLLEAAMDYEDSDKDLMTSLDSLANYFVELGKKANNKDLTRDYFAKVSRAFVTKLFVARSF